MFGSRDEPDGRVAGYAMNMTTGEMKEVLRDEAWYVKYVDSGHLIVQSGEYGQLSAYPFSEEKLAITGLAHPLDPRVSKWDWFVTRSGHFISYTDQQAGLLELVEIKKNGTITKLLEEKMDFEEFQVSSSGDKLVLEVNGYENGRDQILLYDLNSGTLRQLTFNAQFYEPTVSPDGKKIALVSLKNGAQNIAELNLNGTGSLHWLTSNEQYSGDPDWSPTEEYRYSWWTWRPDPKRL